MSDIDFFLSSTWEDDDKRFLAPARSGVTVTPLVDGEETFKAMEEAIGAARKSVHIAFWFFNPATPLVSEKKTTWAALLRRKVAERNELTVRIILSNLDPVLQKFYHAAAWKAYGLLHAEASKLSQTERRRFQVICSRHDLNLGSGVSEILLSDEVNTIIAELNRKGIEKAKKELKDLPGLWKYLALNKVKKRLELAKDPVWMAFPASHHQKIVIVDGETAFCGGLDVNTGRLDNAKHESLKIPWHDSDCKVVGPTVDDIERNFRWRWNAEAPKALEYLKEVNNNKLQLKIEEIAAEPYEAKIEKPKPPLPPNARMKEITVTAQVHRTLSEDDIKQHEPAMFRDDVKISYREAIAQAKSFIYVENQYVRSELLLRWLERQAKAEPELVMIMVIPVAPEEFSEKEGADLLTEHGMFLQRTLIERLQQPDVFGERFGVYSLVQKKAAKKEAATNAHGSAQIYVHSKVLIVDDRFASVGSANANARSFDMDTELALGYVGPPVRDLRVKLWTELLGTDEFKRWQPKEFVEKWNAIAKENAAAKKKGLPRGRRGFVVPHDPSKFPGKKLSVPFGLPDPDKFTQLLDLKTSPADGEILA